MSIYDQALEILKRYMGPAARQFLDRQVSRVGGDASLSAATVPELAKWCCNSAALVIGDDKADEIRTKILALK